MDAVALVLLQDLLAACGGEHITKATRSGPTEQIRRDHDHRQHCDQSLSQAPRKGNSFLETRENQRSRQANIVPLGRLQAKTN